MTLPPIGEVIMGKAYVVFGVGMVTNGMLDDQGRPRIVLIPVLGYSRGSEVGEGQPDPMRCEESDRPIVVMTPSL